MLNIPPLRLRQSSLNFRCLRSPRAAKRASSRRGEKKCAFGVVARDANKKWLAIAIFNVVGSCFAGDAKMLRPVAPLQPTNWSRLKVIKVSIELVRPTASRPAMNHRRQVTPLTDCCCPIAMPRFTFCSPVIASRFFIFLGSHPTLSTSVVVVVV